MHCCLAFLHEQFIVDHDHADLQIQKPWIKRKDYKKYFDLTLPLLLFYYPLNNVTPNSGGIQYVTAST